MNNQVETNPRLTMARLPNWLQDPLTRITGCALPGQSLRIWHPWQYALVVVTWFMTGLAGTSWLIAQGGLWLLLLPATWFLTVAGGRGIQLGLVHHMAHANCTGLARLDDILGQIISMVLIIEDFGQYKRGHLLHHSEALSTKADPTRQTYEAAGLMPGLPLRTLQRRLASAMVCPAYHARAYARRIMSHYQGTSWLQSAGMSVWLATLIGCTALEPYFLVFAWWLPTTLGFQNCSLVRSVIRHWLPPSGRRKGLDVMASKTSAIFCGVPLPPKGRTKVQEARILTRWCAAMAVETVCRCIFVSADGPNHDLHHLQPRGDWANHASLRELMVQRYARKSVALTETWGFVNTLRCHLKALAGQAK